MSEKISTGKAYPSLVPNMAAIDKFTAPDSTAKRPNPESLHDRPRTPNQIPSTAIEADLKQNS